jgi:hypothetical protein
MVGPESRLSGPDHRGIDRGTTQDATVKPTARPTKQADPEIEALDLAPLAKSGAVELKRKHPSIKFTSGRRSVHDQARAMASNVVKKRQWIKQTYVAPIERAELQKWVDDHPGATSLEQIAAGLESVMSGWSEQKKGRLSKHFSGMAFDVQPVAKDANAIKADIRALKGCTFLEMEGGLVRWHAQF